MLQSFDPARFRDVLHTTAFGRNLIFEPVVGSTMDVARDAARHGAPEGTLVVADVQTAGRGRLGRSWVTPPAANLASTLILRPALGVLRQIAMIAPLAVCAAVEETTGIRADIKWPNDVQIRAKKLSGILIETDVGDDDAMALVLVGTGINVNFDPREFEEIRDIATSLLVEMGALIEREPLLAAYLAEFERLYGEAKAGASMRNRWRERLVTIGQRVSATYPGGCASGVGEDVDDEGSLLVRTDDGTLVTVEAGDVTLRV